MTDNISFFLEEKTNYEKPQFDINSILNELTDECTDYLTDFYYEKEYTIKELLKICDYYGIDKNISKCKKQEIISSIIFFESLPENSNIVKRRHEMWEYILKLKNDPKMKKYVLWT